MSSHKIIVSKFGGTSMGDSLCMLRSAEISIDRKSKIIAVSATSGTTNALIEISKQAQNADWQTIERLILNIKTRHLKIASELNSNIKTLDLLNNLFTELESLAKGVFYLKDCSDRALDAICSLGERMSSILFTQAMQQKLDSTKSPQKAILIDARHVICTDNQFGKAKPNLIKTFENAQKIFDLNNQSVVYVTQGFIGASEEGTTTTLGRGGSDYSAALLAEAVRSDVLEIWTDVAGIATTDPRLVPQAKPIEEISFKEASELAIFGAKILHPATLLPAMRMNIPTFVGSSFDPHQAGTWIKKEVGNHPLIRALAVRKKQALVTISTPEMLNTHGFLFQIFKIFNDHQVSIDAITTSEISVAMTLDESTLENRNLILDLQKIADVQIEKDLSLVSLIGNNINHTSGLASQIFDAITDINVRMICLGASKHNFCFLVSDQNATLAIQKLHKKFLE